MSALYDFFSNSPILVGAVIGVIIAGLVIAAHGPRRSFWDRVRSLKGAAQRVQLSDLCCADEAVRGPASRST